MAPRTAAGWVFWAGVAGGWTVGVALLASRRAHLPEALTAALGMFVAGAGVAIAVGGLDHCVSMRASGFTTPDGRTFTSEECLTAEVSPVLLVAGLLLAAGSATATARFLGALRRAPERARPIAAWASLGRLLIGGFAGFLLLSFGAQIMAAPVTIPLLWIASRRASPPARGALAAIATITASYAGWALAYALAREALPWIVLSPLALAAATLVLFRAPPGRAGH